MMIYTRAYRADEGLEEERGPLRFTASTPGMKRDGLDLDPRRILLDNYQRNPVVTWAHDLQGRHLPIGRAQVALDEAGERLVADIWFDDQDEFARQIEGKYRRGFLNAVSIAWSDVRRDGETFHELLEIAAVPVPADPDALIEREREALAYLRRALDTALGLTRGAIPPHTTPKAPEDTSWDAAAEVAKAEGRAQLRMMHAWVDPEGDPDAKQSYKLPHHLATGEVVWHGVAAAMARLFQETTQIPEADRRGVYNHLVRHYQQFDREPPEFRTVDYLQHLTAEQRRGLFLAGEPELCPECFPVEESDAAASGTEAVLRDILARLDRITGGMRHDRA